MVAFKTPRVSKRTPLLEATPMVAGGDRKGDRKVRCRRLLPWGAFLLIKTGPAIIQRQRHRKHRPFTHLTLNRHLSAQKIHELLDNSESQTGALIILGAGRIPSMKFLEDLIQLFLWDP